MIVSTQKLVFEYQTDEDKTVIALNGISIEIEKGSFVAVLGKNGSGKSTLAKNINALLLPSSGAVYVNGYNTKDEEFLWDIRQAAGMVFQNPDNQLVSAIAEDDVAFGPENLGIPSEEIRGRVDDALKSVGMYQYAKTSLNFLSGGQKQRIAIAGVLAMRPQCIIMDEPTAMLDPQGRKDVIEIAESLNREGITVILITHFMEEAARADRVIVMNDGNVVLDGAPRDVFSNIGVIKEAGLALPLSIEMAHRLRERGIEVPKGIISEEDFVKWVLS
ncbi:MAG: energy-coupling factor transporter ATPase [Eubacteriales bacterium]|nr:energy-coupling factor transporter ATPase [Eubacteriales bacterium]MDD4390523.1 energy-coupling factor transporter ATPase [Eubacteriales bacterium]